MESIGGLSRWRWIFIIEGLLTVIAEVLAKFTVFDWPANTKKLTATEKEILRTRMENDGEKARMDTLSRKALKRVASDWKIYNLRV